MSRSETTTAPYVSVIGAQTCSDEIAALALSVGAELAKAGCIVVNGGLTGVMEAASKGASQAGGTVVAIVPDTDRSSANPWASVIVATGIGHARNLAVVASGDVVIAVGGEWGTLSEIGMARSLDRQVVLLASWELDHESFVVEGVHYAGDPAQAARQAIGLASAPSPP